jgi:hypothetical protein
MSTPHVTPAIALLVIVLGFVGCNDASHAAPSSIPTPHSPRAVSPLSAQMDRSDCRTPGLVGLFVLGSGNGEAQSFGWRYTDNATTGTFTLIAPGQPGQYEFRCRMTSTPMSREAAS